MKIWFRAGHWEFMNSWEVVSKYLHNAFVAIGQPITQHTQPLPSCWDMDDVVEIWWGNPADWRWSEHKVRMRIGMCLSESRSLLDEGRMTALENLTQCDALICPAHHAAQAYREAPINVPIYIVPFGVDPKEFPYVPRSWASILKFLHMGRIQFRKGSWLVPDAFRRAFRDDEKVSLTIACAADETPMYKQLQREYNGDCRITFVSGYKESAMSYYKGHHVLVAPHLAEGWGLCIPEALATGMAALVARCSAPLEFFQERFGYWIEMSELYMPIRNCLNNTGGQWRIPDIDSLANTMQMSYNNIKRCEDAGVIASEAMHNSLTWEDTATAIMEVINDG